MALSPEQEALLEKQRASKMQPWEYVKYLGMDLVRSFGSGIEQNVASYPGAGGDTYNLLAAGDIVRNKYLKDATPEEIEALRRYYAENKLLPTTEELQDAIPGKTYQPKTTAGEWTEEITSLLGPRGIMRGAEHLGRNVIMPWLGSKAGEVVGEQLGPEEAELLSAGGGLGAGPVYEGGKRTAVRVMQGPRGNEAATTMMTLQDVPEPLTPESPNARAERIRRLTDEGVDVSGGQALGNEFVKRLEAGPYSTKGGAMNEQQGRQITRAALRAIGIDSELASPEVLDAAQQRFGQFYEGLARQSNGVVMDPTLQQALIDIGTNYEGVAGVQRSNEGHVNQFFNRIVDASQQHGGVIPPEAFNAIHSELSAAIRSISNDPSKSSMRMALRDMQDALYDTIGRNGQPEIQAQARDLNNRYRNFKIVEKSVGGGGEGVSFGLVSPEKLRAELERRDPSAYRQGRGDLARLARDTQSLTAMPVSGTGAQLAANSLSGVATTALFNAPVSAALTFNPVRTSIVNRATGVNPAFLDPMQMPPVISQSGEEVPMLPYPGMPAPVEVEEEATLPVVPPAAAAPAPVEVAPVEPLPPAPATPAFQSPLRPLVPDQRSELDMPVPIPDEEMLALLAGRILPGRV